MYGDAYIVYMNAANKQFVGRVGLFLKVLDTDDLYATPAFNNNDYVVQRKQTFFEQERCATGVVSRPFYKRVYIAVHEDWFEKNVTKKLRRVHKRCILEKTEPFLLKIVGGQSKKNSIICLNCYVLQ